ncbi:MAG TPA: hypothetical protein VFJ70_18985 [Burkholderiales bacterium]|nr:hypothetical protein [Burkholderiales bacterium]
MTWWSFIERIIVPTVMLCLLVGGVAGFVFGCALALRSGPTLQFINRMNRWVSTREALRPLEEPHQIDPAPESPYRRLLGALFIVGGALTIYFLLTRLQVARLVDAKRALGLAIVLDATKAVFLAGGGFALVVGALMVFWPQGLAAMEARLNRWYSTRRLVAAEERMHTPLEPRVEAHPREAGWIIAIASLAIAIAMAWLLVTRVMH